MQAPFWKASDSIFRDKLLNDLFAIVEACSSLGVRKIVVPLVDNGSITNARQEKLLIKEFRSINGFLIENNVKILFETDFSPIKTKKFIKNFPVESFGINYDTGNSAALGFSPSLEFSLFHYYIHNIHLKDRLLHGGTVPLGEGHVDFKLVFENLKKFNYNKNLILQTARASDGNHVAAILQFRDFILDIWKKT